MLAASRRAAFIAGVIRISSFLLTAVLAIASPVAVSPVTAQFAASIGDVGDPAEALGRHLRSLSASPRDLSALIGAGRAALALGDANGALSFFGRADEVDPRNGRVKAGLGAALLALEQPRDAIRLFDEAVAFGVPAGEIAGDRGLAHDLRGDARKAQADYAVALQYRSDPEVVRRLALSQAISGDRAGALATLDPLTRQQDRAAWRARAFVLAMTGDQAGANDVAGTMMPRQAGMLAAYFAKLPSMRGGDKAAAVHFGRFPADRRSDDGALRMAAVDPVVLPGGAASQTRADAALIPAGAPLGRVSVARGGGDPADERSVFKVDVGKVDPGTARRSATAGAEEVKVVPKPAAASPRLALAAVDFEPAPPPTPPVARAASLPKREVAPKPEARVSEIAKPVVEVKPKSDAKTVAKADPKATKADPKLAKADTKSTKVEKKPTHPERYWVQVASGKNRGDLDKVWARLQKEQPKLLGGRAPWTTPWKASNRLVTGPFKSADEAQALVNQLGKAGMSTFQLTTREGILVEKL